MELFLIRHGQSANNANPGGVRHHDPPLTELGLQQAERLAVWSESLNLTRVIASPFLRAMQTAEEIRRFTAIPADVWVDLHEQGGCCTGPDPVADLAEHQYQGHPGMSDAELRTQYPAFVLSDDIDHQGWWRSRPFEPMQQARQRAGVVISKVQAQFGDTDERVALVFHGMLKLLVLDSIFGRFHEETVGIVVPYNTSVSKITITTDSIELGYYNGIEHLQESMLTD